MMLPKRHIACLIKPSLSTSPFDERVVLQFQHFASLFFITVGSADSIHRWSAGLTNRFIEAPAFGVGLYLGTRLLMRLYHKRFQNPVAEQVATPNP